MALATLAPPRRRLTFSPAYTAAGHSTGDLLQPQPGFGQVLIRHSHLPCSLLLYSQLLQIHINSNLFSLPTCLQSLPDCKVNQHTRIIPSCGAETCSPTLVPAGNLVQLSWETSLAVGQGCVWKAREDSPPSGMLCPAGCGRSPSSTPWTETCGSLCCYYPSWGHSHCKRGRINCPALQGFKHMPGISSSANCTFTDIPASPEGHPSCLQEAHCPRDPTWWILGAGLRQL